MGMDLYFQYQDYLEKVERYREFEKAGQADRGKGAMAAHRALDEAAAARKKVNEPSLDRYTG